MTNTDRDLEALVQLGVLRAFREAGVPTTPDRLSPRWAGAVPLVLDTLIERGLLVQLYPGTMPGMYQTTAEADRLLEAVEDAGARMLAEFDPCPYDFAHTRHWCGHATCRDS